MPISKINDGPCPEIQGAISWLGYVAGYDWKFLCIGPTFLDVHNDCGCGSAIELVMRIYGLKFKAATKRLKERGL